MFQDVQFLENNLPSELAISDISMLAFSTNIIDKLLLQNLDLSWHLISLVFL